MDELQLRKKGKRLAWLLRHGATDVGLDMDEAGWVDVEEVLVALGMTFEELECVVRDNDKQRIELVGGRLRACQGHSLENHAVTPEALEGSWTVYTGDDSVWHGTDLDALESIARDGIQPVGRTHVHLAPAMNSRVGLRGTVDVMLEISPMRMRAAGLNLYVASNGVLLAREVPAACIVGLHPMTKRAQDARSQLPDMFECVGK